MLTWLSRFLQYVSNSLCPLKFVTAALFAKLASLCLPSVSLTRPLSPLLSPCSCLQLLLGLVSSSAPPCSTAESSWVLLFWKECASMWLPTTSAQYCHLKTSAVPEMDRNIGSFWVPTIRFWIATICLATCLVLFRSEDHSSTEPTGKQHRTHS